MSKQTTIFFSYRHIYNTPTSIVNQETLIVLVAFISTAVIFGFILYSYVSSIFEYGTTGTLNVGSIALYYDGNRVWRIVIPISVTGKSVDLRASNINVNLSIGDDYSYSFINIRGVNHYYICDDVTLLGKTSIHFSSGSIKVREYNGGSVEEKDVDFIVYIDEYGRLHIIVDDEYNHIADRPYLIEFISNIKGYVKLNPDGEIILSVSKGSKVPVEYLDLILSYPSKPDIYIRVKDPQTNRYYEINPWSIALNLRSLTITSIIKGNGDYYLTNGEQGYIVILLPGYLTLKPGDNVKLSIKVADTLVFDGAFQIPGNLTKVGLIVVSVR